MSFNFTNTVIDPQLSDISTFRFSDSPSPSLTTAQHAIPSATSPGGLTDRLSPSVPPSDEFALPQMPDSGVPITPTTANPATILALNAWCSKLMSYWSLNDDQGVHLRQLATVSTRVTICLGYLR